MCATRMAPQASPAPLLEGHPLALVLGGGGGKGGAHLGVLSVIERLGVPFDLIVGTSIGGLIGVLYAAGYSIEQIATHFKRNPLWRLFLPEVTGAALTSNARLRAILTRLLGNRSFDDLPVPCAVTAVDLVRGQPVVLNQGPLVDALLATIALPGVFPPVRRGDQLLVDGGVLNNVPVDVARVAGAQKIIAVDLCDAPVFVNADVTEPLVADAAALPSALSVVNRAIDIMTIVLKDHHLALVSPDLVIQPDVRQIGVLDFRQIDAGRQVGVEAAQRAASTLLALAAWRNVEPSPAASEALVRQRESRRRPAHALLPILQRRFTSLQQLCAAGIASLRLPAMLPHRAPRRR